MNGKYMLASLLFLTGCGGCGGDPEAEPPPDAAPPFRPRVLSGPSRGGAIDLSRDDSRLVVANRDAGTISVFSVTYVAEGPSLVRVAEVPVCAEPWQVVVHPLGETAYVVCRKDQKVVSVTGLAGAQPVKGPEISVGSEPTSIALTPLGTTVWVANWVDGTLQAIDTATMKAADPIDLNTTLAGAGYLGAVAPRPALAHPRSIAITNNGDEVESDETLYVTEYFAQQKEVLAADGSNADTARVGLLYKIPLSTLTPAVIELSPINDMRFKDHKGGTAGCFPNQLQSITINGAFGYVTSVCASPKGPMATFMPATCTIDADCGAPPDGKCIAGACAPNESNIRTTVASAVTIVDLGGSKTFATVNLNWEFWSAYERLGTPDNFLRRMPLLVNDGAFIPVPSSATAFFTAGGSDAVFRVDFNAAYKDGATIDSIGDAVHPFIDLALPQPPPSGELAKAGPIGIVVAHQAHPDKISPRYAFVANDASRSVAVINLKDNEVAGASAGKPVIEVSSAMPTKPEEAAVAEGKRLFNFGLNRWSLNGQAWGTCAECHVDGLSDNVTWFFARGPRQSISLDGAYAKKTSAQRLYGWNASFDEPSDLEAGVLRTMFGGVGLIVKGKSVSSNADRIAFETLHGGLNGSSLAAADPLNPAKLPEPCVRDDWAKVVAYLKTVRSPRRPTNLDAARVAAGKELFASAHCAGCHGGELWSTSGLFYTPDRTGAANTALKSKSWTQAVTLANFPLSLLPAQTAAAQTMRYNGTDGASFDALTCALRPVDTFAKAEPGVVVAEKRRDMATVAQGDETDGKGFSPPSLLALSVGAPYYHGGNARTLEGALGTGFAGHHAALSAGFLPDDAQRASKVLDLVHFLLSLDEDTDPMGIPPLGPLGGSFCSPP